MAISNKLALEVERVLNENGLPNRPLSLRDAERMCRVNYTTIGQMLKGHVPKPETIAKFAQGFGEDAISWLAFCGFGPENLPTATCRQDDPEEAELLRYFRRLPAEKRSLVREVVAGFAT